MRANGSRECAPDDRLREAIQNLRELDCFVAKAPRNDVLAYDDLNVADDAPPTGGGKITKADIYLELRRRICLR